MKPFANPGLGLGRLIVPDERDRNYPITALTASPVSSAPAPTTRFWWDQGWHGNQRSTPHCVAFSFAHWLNDGPHPYSMFDARRPGVDTTELYCEAQKRDGIPGDCSDPQYNGTTLRAGASVMRAWGHITEYRWAFTLEEVVDWLSRSGTIVAGTWWYESMFYPDADGMVGIAGHAVGGHAYLLHGVDTEAEVVRFKNSWGRYWGRDGNAYMTFETLQLLMSRAGEMCIPIAS